MRPPWVVTPTEIGRSVSCRAESLRRATTIATPAGVRIKRQQNVLEPDLVEAMLGRLDEHGRHAALRGLELLAEAAREVVTSGELNRFLRAGGT